MCALMKFSLNSAVAKLSNMSQLLLVLTHGLLMCTMSDAAPGSVKPVDLRLYSAVVNFSYVDPVTRTLHQAGGNIGRYGFSSRLEPEHGVVVHVRSGDGLHHGCLPPVNVPQGGRQWIALVRRGDCKFNEKIYNTAVLANASAVVVYNQKDEETLITMQHFGE